MRMQGVDEGRGQRGDDVEEGDGQQHQRGRRRRHLLSRGGDASLVRQAAELAGTGPPRARDTPNDQHIDHDGGQRHEEVERHLRGPQMHLVRYRVRQLIAAVSGGVVDVAVGVESGAQEASGEQTRNNLHARIYRPQSDLQR